MKRKNKGFTLIELLAVIVILAIIALIAVPVVMNIITKARKSAFKDSAYGIIKAGELYYADRLLEPDGMTEDKMFTFPNEVAGLDIEGSKPKDGSVIVTTEGKVAIGVTNGKYCITKGFEDTDVTVTEEVENCKNPEEPKPIIMTSENSCIQAGNTCSADDIKSGIVVNVKVNNEQTEDFYVLADDEDKVILILNRNLGDNVEWNADDDMFYGYGPTTALTHLKSQTSTWTNLPEMTISTYEQEYAGNITEVALDNNQTFTTYARLPKYSELYAINNSTSLFDASWLYKNLYGTGDDQDSNGHYRHGYWTPTANSDDPSYTINSVNFGGYNNDGYYSELTFVSSKDNLTGVRPVIELSK